MSERWLAAYITFDRKQTQTYPYTADDLRVPFADLDGWWTVLSTDWLIAHLWAGYHEPTYWKWMFYVRVE